MSRATSDASSGLPPRTLRARAAQAYQTQSREAREDAWIVSHLPLVRHVVQKIAGHVGPGADLDELISAGTVGLVKAAKAYDPGKHAEFKTYAYIRIRGAVLDELRTRRFGSVDSGRMIRKVREAHQAFEAANGRPPSDEELAAQAGVTVDRLHQALEDARRQHFLSIHSLSDDGPALGSLLAADDESAPDGRAERNDLVRRMAAAIQELDERDRTIVLLYYERDLTMKEIALTLGVTESRVSQMHAAALFRLGMKLRRPG